MKNKNKIIVLFNHLCNQLKNKFLMFITNHNPAGCPLCSFSDDKLLCCSKYNLFINTLLVDNCNSENNILLEMLVMIAIKFENY